MTKEPAAQPPSPSRPQGPGYRTLLFGACLVISVTIHIAAVVALLLTKTAARQPAVAGFMEMKDFVPSRPPASPEIRMPAPSRERHEQMPAPAPKADRDAAKEVDSPAAANPFADVLATPLGRGMASGFFSPLAEGRSLRDDIRGYYFELLERINDRWWQKAAALQDTARRDGVVEVLIGRDGTLYGVRLLGDTGSREVDRAITDVLSAASPFPPLPAGYAPELFRAPLRFAAPSMLFGPSRRR